MKVLCIPPIGLGNYLMAYPAMALLKEQRPELELHLLALRKGMALLAQGDPIWSEIYAFDPTKEKSLKKRWSFIREMQQHRFDVSLSFFPANNAQYNLLPLLLGIEQRWNYRYPHHDVKNLGFLNSDRLDMNPNLHDVEQDMNLSRAFLLKNFGEVNGSHKTFPLLYNDLEAHWAKTEIPGNYIAIHAGSSIEHGMDAKRWAPEKFATLADKLLEENPWDNTEIVFFGGPEEEVLKEEILRLMKHPQKEERARIAPIATLARTAALLAQAKVAICNDSGLMHMAAVSGTPIAAIFGPTDEKRNGPRGPRLQSCILRHELPGFPCWTAETVGDRSLANNVNPRAPIEALSAKEAWQQLQPFLQQLKNNHDS
jgi:heptosyltransferase-2